MLALVLQETPQFWTWQNFLIANLAGLFLVVFWAGILTSRITQLREHEREHSQAHKDQEKLHAQVHKDLEAAISHHSQVIPVTELKVKLDGIDDKLDKFAREFEDLRKSIFIQAVTQGQPKPQHQR